MNKVKVKKKTATTLEADELLPLKPNNGKSELEYIENPRTCKKMIIYEDFCYVERIKRICKTSVTCRRKNCRGSGVIYTVSDKTQFIPRNSHIHPSDVDYIQRVKSKSELLAKSKPLNQPSLKRIFDKDSQSNQEESNTTDSPVKRAHRHRSKYSGTPSSGEQKLKATRPFASNQSDKNPTDCNENNSSFPTNRTSDLDISTSQIQFIEGSRVGSRMVVYEDYCYILSNKRNNKIYLTCRKKNCTSSAIIYGCLDTCDGRFSLGRAHSHPPDVEFIQTLKFKADLRLESKHSNGSSVKTIFERVSQRHQGTGGVSFTTAGKSIIKRSRKRDTMAPCMSKEHVLKEILSSAPQSAPPSQLKSNRIHKLEAQPNTDQQENIVRKKSKPQAQSNLNQQVNPVRKKPKLQAHPNIDQQVNLIRREPKLQAQPVIELQENRVRKKSKLRAQPFIELQGNRVRKKSKHQPRPVIELRENSVRREHEPQAQPNLDLQDDVVGREPEPDTQCNITLLESGVKREVEFVEDQDEVKVSVQNQPDNKTLQEIEFIEGSRVGTKVLIFQDFCYIHSRRRGTKLYVTCRRKNCRGSGIISDPLQDSEFGYFSLGKAHTHPPEVEYIQKLKFKADLRHESQSSRNSSLRSIFNKVSQRHQGATNKIDFASVGSLMIRSRRRTKPPTVSCLQDLGNVINTHQWSSLGMSYQISQPWFRGIHTAIDGTKIAAFLNEEVCKALSTVQPISLQCDGTFKHLPPELGACHLFTCLVSIQDKTFGFAFFLVEAKSTATYLKCLEVLEECTGSIDPYLILTDFELNLHTALTTTWPYSSIHGCYYHFVHDVVNKCREDDNILAVDEEFCIIKLFLALPYLPAEHIMQGFNIAQGIVANNNLTNLFHKFIEDFTEQWLVSVDPGVLSVFRQRSQISNGVEVLHQKMKDSLYTKNKIWPFIDGLRTISHHEQTDFFLFFSGMPEVRRKKAFHIKQDKLLEEAMTSFSAVTQESIVPLDIWDDTLIAAIVSLLNTASSALDDLVMRIMEEPRQSFSPKCPSKLQDYYSSFVSQTSDQPLIQDDRDSEEEKNSSDISFTDHDYV